MPGLLATFVGQDNKPIALLLSSNAYSRLIGTPHVTAGNLIGVNGAVIDGTTALMDALDIPGIIIKEPVVEGERSGVADGQKAARIEGMKSVSDIVDLVGPATVDTCKLLAGLWDKLGKTPYFTKAQADHAKAACLLGLLAFPASAREVKNMRPNAEPGKTAPPVTDANRAGYDAIVSRFKVIRNNYYARQYGAAVAAAQAAESDAAWWDTIYTVVQAVADAPATIVGAVGDATLGFVGGFLARTWYLWLIVAAGAFVWFNKGALASMASKKAMAAIEGKPNAA